MIHDTVVLLLKYSGDEHRLLCLYGESQGGPRSGPSLSDVMDRLPPSHLEQLLPRSAHILPGDIAPPTAFAEAPRARSGWRCPRH